MRRQRGVALLMVLLAVALAVVLIAAAVDRGEALRARTAYALRGEQSFQLMLGLEGLAARILREDAAISGSDHRGEYWAQPLPPIDVPGARIAGRLRDLGGCFDVNALVRGGVEQPHLLARLQRLLRALGLDPLLALRIADYVDADVDPRPGGGEDLALLQAVPPRRAANRPLADVSELRAIAGIDAATYARLAPELCALRGDQPLNLNTASPAQWMSLDERIGAEAARRLARDGQARYAGTEAVLAELERQGFPGVDLRDTGLSSAYFVAEAEIRADGLPFQYASLLHRDGGDIAVLARQSAPW